MKLPKINKTYFILTIICLVTILLSLIMLYRVAEERALVVEYYESYMQRLCICQTPGATEVINTSNLIIHGIETKHKEQQSPRTNTGPIVKDIPEYDTIQTQVK